RREGFAPARQRHERSLAVRYKGQSFELEIKQTSGNIAAAFHRAHRARYGYEQKDNAVEIVSVRLRSRGLTRPLPTQRPVAGAQSFAEPDAYADAVFAKTRGRIAVYRRENLTPGAQLRTPCIVTEYSATTLVPDETTTRMDDYGNLTIEVQV